MFVARKTTGEVASYIAIGHLFCAIHQHFRTIIELWNAVNGEQKSQGLFQCKRVFAILQEAICVVIFNESHHT